MIARYRGVKGVAPLHLCASAPLLGATARLSLEGDFKHLVGRMTGQGDDLEVALLARLRVLGQDLVADLNRLNRDQASFGFNRGSGREGADVIC